MTRRELLTVFPLSFALAAQAQEKYSGPRPSQKDLPYLLEADKLVPVERQQASESNSKAGQVLSVPGTTSKARTPLPEPIFLLWAEKITPDQLGIYRFEVKDGRREVVIGRHKSEDDEVLRLTVRPLDEGLFRIEASEMLDPGEYALSPEGANTAFCFTVY
jgi:hypothetical protein